MKLFKSRIISLIINLLILIFLSFVIFNVTRTFFNIGRSSMQIEVSVSYDTNYTYSYYLI